MCNTSRLLTTPPSANSLHQNLNMCDDDTCMLQNHVTAGTMLMHTFLLTYSSYFYIFRDPQPLRLYTGTSLSPLVSGDEILFYGFMLLVVHCGHHPLLGNSMFFVQVVLLIQATDWILMDFFSKLLPLLRMFSFFNNKFV